jgi:large subunit ribosomal protein L28
LRLVREIDLKFIGKMSQICQITGKKMMVGNNVSHSKRRTKRTFQPNLFDKKFYLEEEDRYVTLRVSAQGIRTINKNGLKATLDKAVKKGFLKSY